MTNGAGPWSASPPTIDVDALLAPIPGESRAGKSLRYAGTYDAIQEARRSDDELEQGEWQREVKVADWSGVIGLTEAALAVESKDVQIATWLAEALMRRHGFSGLRDGLTLLSRLQEEFWDDLFPEIEDGDLDLRAAPLHWLNEKLAASVRAIPFAPLPSGDTYSWLQYEESRATDNLGRQSAEAMSVAIADGKLTGEQFDQGVLGLSRAHYETVVADLREAIAAQRRLGEVCDDKFGRDAPSLVALGKSLADVSGVVEQILKRKRVLEPDPSDAAATEDDGAAGDIGHAAPARGAVGGRVEALRKLQEVAAFFRRTEPHSPVAYLVERAVHWGALPLDKWLEEVIADEGVLLRVRETLGLKPPPSTT